MGSSSTKKIKVGIFIGGFSQDTGGAFTLLETIQDEIISNNNQSNYVFLYHDKYAPYKKEIDGFSYINLSFNKKQHLKNTVICKFILKILKKLKIYKEKSYPLLWETAIKSENLDIIWITQPIKEDISIPYIYTVWDLGHRTAPFFPEVSRSGWLWQERENLYKKMLFKASYILTGNETGKKEILENYSLPSEKIRIAPFPIASFCYGEETKTSFNLPNKYFFYPAQFWPHKNHICILEALKILKEEKQTVVHVIFTGSDKGNKQYILDKVKEYNLEDQIVFAGFLSEQELKYVYTHAQAMIFASLLGPNNMPPIEATYLNCPVIITDLEGHQEQLGNTALYFNGFDSKSLAIQISKLLLDLHLRNDLIEKQKKLAIEFQNVNYFQNVNTILKEFEKVRNTWGNEYHHL